MDSTAFDKLRPNGIYSIGPYQKALLVRQCLYTFTSADDAVAALPFLLSNHAAHLNGEMNMNYKRRLSEVLTTASRDVSVQPRHFQGDPRNNRQRQG
jgi:hypothetical protein